jgi:hypothetical protein
LLDYKKLERFFYNFTDGGIILMELLFGLEVAFYPKNYEGIEVGGLYIHIWDM